MNKYIGLSIIAVGLGLTSCNDFLDKIPDNRTEVTSEEQVTLLLTTAYSSNNSIIMAESEGLFYMFHGDVTYCDAALKANKLSIVFEDKDAARETLDRVRQFIQDNPTVYLSTHCPEGYENLEMKRIMKL